VGDHLVATGNPLAIPMRLRVNGLRCGRYFDCGRRVPRF